MENYQNILCIKMIGDETYDIFVIQGGKNIVGLKQNQSSRRESQEVISVIDQILQENNLSLTGLDLIAVMHGYGSFTSNRLGVITANTLAYTLRIPVIGIEITQDSHTSPQDFVNLVDDYIAKQKILTGQYITPKYSS